MHYELWINFGRSGKPSGFPLYLFPLTLQKDAAPIPNAAGEWHNKICTDILNVYTINMMITRSVFLGRHYELRSSYLPIFCRPWRDLAWDASPHKSHWCSRIPQLSIFQVFRFSDFQILSFSDLKKFQNSKVLKKSPRGIYFVSLLPSLRSCSTP